MQNFKLGLLELVRSGSASSVAKGCCRRLMEFSKRVRSWMTEPRVRIPRGYYHLSSFMRFMYKFSYSKGAWLIDGILCLMNVSLITSDALVKDRNPSLCSFSNAITYSFVVFTAVQLFSKGWWLSISDLIDSSNVIVSLAVLIELHYYHEPYAKTYVFKTFSLVTALAMIPLPKQVKIFLKSVINYVPYLLPYGIMLACYVIVMNTIALQLFPSGYSNPEFADTSFDLFLKYLPSTLSLFIGSDWASVMQRTAEVYGGGVSVYYILQVSFTRFVLDNCLLSYFIFTFSEVYWQYHKQPSNKIVLQFEKSATQKKELLTRSIFHGLSEQKAHRDFDKYRKEKEERQKLMAAVRSGTERPSDGYKFFNSAIKMFMSSPRKTFISPTRASINKRKLTIKSPEVSLGKDLNKSDSGPPVSIPQMEEITHERMHQAKLDDVESGKVFRSSRIAAIEQEFSDRAIASLSPKSRVSRNKPEPSESSQISRFPRADKPQQNNFLNHRRGNLFSDTVVAAHLDEQVSSRPDNTVFSPREPEFSLPTEENKLVRPEARRASPNLHLNGIRDETVPTAEDQNQLRVANHPRTRSRTTLRNKLTQIMPSNFLKIHSQGDLDTERRFWLTNSTKREDDDRRKYDFKDQSAEEHQDLPGRIDRVPTSSRILLALHHQDLLFSEFRIRLSPSH